MASNHFGNLFKILTWGESHGKAIGVVIDGCPSGLKLIDDDINHALLRRAPGQNPFTSPRKEKDVAEILSGVFEGVTTGCPISIIIQNKDQRTTDYEPIKDLLRPGHANYTYLEKYGVFDFRGGGRSSGRETACRVAAGAVAQKLLCGWGIEVAAYLKQIGDVQADVPLGNLAHVKQSSYEHTLFCPDLEKNREMEAFLLQVLERGDSIGGIVEFCAKIPTGLGDPVYEKLEANLAKAMMSLPATKGFEMGEGFKAASMSGSAHNDQFYIKDGTVALKTNYSGGTLGGISNGMPLVGRVVFKPTSSINVTQSTLSVNNEERILKLPPGSRHDPCIAVRAVPVVEAMLALVLVDSVLMNKSARL
ncbi:MAG: chorismate synthase [Parachlamydiaceae bacterium]